MKKIPILVFSLLIIFIMVIIILIFINPFSQTYKNRHSFKKSISFLSEEIQEVTFNDLVSFDWDFVYSFHPYISNKEINEILGFESNKPLEMMNEYLESIVFVKNQEVVCYFVESPLSLKFSFDFGKGEFHKTESREIDFWKISKNDYIILKVEIKNEIKYFTVL